jgi:hypothetical protein
MRQMSPVTGMVAALRHLLTVAGLAPGLVAFSFLLFGRASGELVDAL